MRERIGREAHGLECIAFSEMNLQAIATYSHFFSNHTKEIFLGDIQKVHIKNIPNTDIRIANFPVKVLVLIENVRVWKINENKLFSL